MYDGLGSAVVLLTTVWPTTGAMSELIETAAKAKPSRLGVKRSMMS
jgi:hypothetical protein